MPIIGGSPHSVCKRNSMHNASGESILTFVRESVVNMERFLGAKLHHRPRFDLCAVPDWECPPEICSLWRGRPSPLIKWSSCDALWHTRTQAALFGLARDTCCVAWSQQKQTSELVTLSKVGSAVWQGTWGWGWRAGQVWCCTWCTYISE